MAAVTASGGRGLDAATRYQMPVRIEEDTTALHSQFGLLLDGAHADPPEPAVQLRAIEASGPQVLASRTAENHGAGFLFEATGIPRHERHDRHRGLGVGRDGLTPVGSRLDRLRLLPGRGARSDAS